ncbi:MAG: hypothetical protein M1341_00910 [Candidatus Thermoplasmatota archaeon]|nr:hypothetical protein [Candidatus Thermoplasmatota archaeon]
MLKTAAIIVSKETRELQDEDRSRRIQRFKDLETFASKYEAECGQGLSPQIRMNDLAMFKLAQLKVASTFYFQGKGTGSNQKDEIEIVGKFTKEEYGALVKLDKFSKIDFLSVGEIATALVNRDEQIFNIIRDWYNEQMDTFLDLVDPKNGSPISGLLAVSMKDRYNKRFVMIRDGIIAYMKQDPGQIRKLFYNYEGMIKKALDVENRRLQLDSELRSIILGEEVEKVIGEFRTFENRLLKRDVKKIYEFDAEGLLKRINALILEVDTKKDSLVRERSRLSDDPELRSNSFLKDVEYQRLSETISLADDLLRKHLMEMAKSIKTFMQLSVEVGGAAADGKLQESDGVSLEASVLGIRKFFASTSESLTSELPFTLYSPLDETEITVDELPDYNPAGQGYFWSAGREHGKVELRKTITFTRNRILSKPVKVILDQSVLVHPKAYEALGIDLQPAGVADFTPIYAELTRKAGEEDAHVVGLIGSPTGFTKSLLDQVEGNSVDPISGSRVTVFLKDIKTGKIHFNRSDETAARYEYLLAGGTRPDPVKALKERTLQEGKYMGIVRIGHMERLTGVEQSSILSAWKDLEKNKKGKVTKVNKETVFELS